MEFQRSKASLLRDDLQILSLFEEIQKSLNNLRNLVEARSQETSSSYWFPQIKDCEEQLKKLFIATYQAEDRFQKKKSNKQFEANIGGN